MQLNYSIFEYTTLMNTCEQTISSYYNTENQEVPTDASVRVTSLIAKNYTMADCVRILCEDSLREHTEAIKYEEEQLAYWKEQLDVSLTMQHNPDRIAARTCIENIKRAENRLEELRDLLPIKVNYEDPEMCKILGISVTCTYRVLSDHVLQEGCDMFILSPDGRSVLYKVA